MAAVKYEDFKKVIVDELINNVGVKKSDLYIHHYRHNTVIGIGKKPKMTTIVDINYDTKFLVSINMKYLQKKLARRDQMKIANITNAYMRTLWKTVNPPFNLDKVNDDGAIN